MFGEIFGWATIAKPILPRPIWIVFVGIIAISPDKLRVFMVTRLVIPFSGFDQVFFHPKAFPIALRKLLHWMVPIPDFFVRMRRSQFIPFDGFHVVLLDTITFKKTISN